MKVIAQHRARLEEEARLEAEQCAQEEQREQEAEQAAEQARRDQVGVEAGRLREAGFALVQEVNGRPLWRHDDWGGVLWHEEATALLDTAEREAAAE